MQPVRQAMVNELEQLEQFMAAEAAVAAAAEEEGETTRLAAEAEAEAEVEAKAARLAAEAAAAAEVETPVTMAGSWCTHLLALPDELLVMILTSLIGLWLRQLTLTAYPVSSLCVLLAARLHDQSRLRQGLRGCACCKGFALRVQEAARVVGDRNGWRLLAVGTTPLRHLLTLEQQVIFVKSHFRMHDSNLWEHLRSPESFWFHWWAQEAHEHFIGPCSIDSQVRRKLILEQPPILRHRIIENQRYRESALPRIIKLGMGVKPGDLERIEKLQMVYEKLLVLTNPELSIFDASWLDAHVVPLIRRNLDITPRTYAAISLVAAAFMLLSHLEPRMLRSHPDIFQWVISSMKSIQCSDGENMWALGQKKWSERCEDHELKVGPCDADTHDAMLYAVVGGSRFRGGFLTLEALDAQFEEGLVGTRGPWPGNAWFPAVYH